MFYRATKIFSLLGLRAISYSGSPSNFLTWCFLLRRQQRHLWRLFIKGRGRPRNPAPFCFSHQFLTKWHRIPSQWLNASLEAKHGPDLAFQFNKTGDPVERRFCIDSIVEPSPDAFRVQEKLSGSRYHVAGIIVVDEGRSS